MTAAIASDERWRLGHRPTLDGLRGVAIAMVVVGHVIQVDTVASNGVTLFFVLSGFLITSLLVEERERTGRVDIIAFYWRRALRLFPALWAMLAAVALFYGLIGLSHRIPFDLLPPLFYVANIVRSAEYGMGLVGHTWSLAVEEQFYILWPFVLPALQRIAARHLPAILVALIVALALWRVGLVLSGAPNARINFALDTRGDAILYGCLAALMIHRLPRLDARALVAGVALVALGSWPDTGFHKIAGLALASTGAAVIILCMARHSNRLLEARWLVGLGAISYGLYLWHEPLVELGQYSGIPWIVTVPLSLIVTLASYRLLERPLRRWRRSLPWRDWQASRSPGTESLEREPAA